MFPSDSHLESQFTFESDADPLPDEPPFNILMLGNWTGNLQKNKLNERKPIVIDRDNFDEVMRLCKVGLDLDLYGDVRAVFRLEFKTIDDFHPDNLFQQIPIFSELRQLRQNLLNSQTFQAAANEIKSWVQAPELVESQTPNNIVPASVSPDNLLEFILSDANSAGKPTKNSSQFNSELSFFVSKIVSDSLVKIDENEQTKLLRIVDETISELMRKVLHHNDFKQLEGAWLGLYFLIRQIETDSDLKVFILDISKVELLDNLKSVNDLTQSFLYQQAVCDTSIGKLSQPFSIVGGNYPFDVNIEDIAALLRLSKISDAVHAPFISYISPKFLSFQTLGSFDSFSEFNVDFTSNEGKLWVALRSSPESEYIGLSPMRCLSRLTYGNELNPIETFSFEELTDFSNHEKLPWMNPCFVIISLLAQNFSRKKWQMFPYVINSIERLPLLVYYENNQAKIKPFTEIFLNENQLVKLFDNGLMPLVSFRDSDKIIVPRFQSISHQTQELKGKWLLK